MGATSGLAPRRNLPLHDKRGFRCPYVWLIAAAGFPDRFLINMDFRHKNGGCMAWHKKESNHSM